MDVKKLALLVGALVIAVITAVMAKNMFAGAGAQQAAAAPAVPRGAEGARRQEGAPGRHDHRCRQPHLSALAEGADAGRLLYRGPAGRRSQEAAGTVVRYAITAGQPVTRGSLVGPQDRGFLAAALGPGMRAVTVPVNVVVAASPASSSRATMSTWC